METKRCSRCGETQPLTEFHRSNQTKDGRRYKCRSCTRLYHQENKAQINARSIKWQRENPERARAAGKRYTLARFGLTEETYAAKLAAQGGVCVICGATEPGGVGRWHIDHDHSCCPGHRSCGKCVRDLLCAACNVGLGSFRDDVERLTAAAEYLKRWA